MTVTIQCNETGIILTETTLVKHALRPMNITGSVSIPQYQQCSISITFSNAIGSSESLILLLGM